MKKGEKAMRKMSGAAASAAGISSLCDRPQHTILCASYSTLLSSRIARIRLKTLIDGAFYPSLKQGGFATHTATEERHS